MPALRQKEKRGGRRTGRRLPRRHTGSVRLGPRQPNTAAPLGVSRARILKLFLAAFGRIRRLRNSPQYLLVVLQWMILQSPPICAILRITSTLIAQTNDKKSWLIKFPTVLRSALMMSIRKIYDRGPQIPCPNSWYYVLNHRTTIMLFSGNVCVQEFEAPGSERTFET